MPKHEPERTCILTRSINPPSGLMRFVLGPDKRVVPDLRNRLPGRGAWVTPTAAAIGEVQRRRLFARAFKQEVAPSPSLVEEIDAALVRDLKGALSLANKAGAVVAGFGKVESAIASGNVTALIHASDAAADGRRKLRAALHRMPPVTTSDILVLDDLPSVDLDVALGRLHVIHAALLAGPGSEGCLACWRRLRVFRGVDHGADEPRDMGDPHLTPRGTEGQG